MMHFLVFVHHVNILKFVVSMQQNVKNIKRHKYFFVRHCINDVTPSRQSLNNLCLTVTCTGEIREELNRKKDVGNKVQLTHKL